MEEGTYITIPIARWKAIQDRMDTLENTITELNGKENVSVVKFNNVSNLEENKTSYVIYTNDEVIKQLENVIYKQNKLLNNL